MRFGNKLKILIGLNILVLVIMPSFVFAQDSCGHNCTGSGVICIPNPLKACTIPEVIDRIVNILTVLIMVFSVIMVLVSAWHFITSSGDPLKIKSAKNTLLYAAIGVIIALFAKIFTSFIVEILGGA